MTEQAKLPDGSVDIVDNVRKLEAFLRKLLDDYGYRDADGDLDVFTDEEIDSLNCQGYPANWVDYNDELLDEFDGYEFDASFSDWLQEQLFIDVCYDKCDDKGFSVSGWSIDITCGGPTVRLKRDPFRGGYTYIHSWGVVSWADPTGHYSPRTTIEFSPALGDQIHDYIQEMYS